MVAYDTQKHTFFLSSVLQQIYLFTNFHKVDKQPPEVFYEKGILKNFSKFTGNHLCRSFLFNKVFKKETPTQVLFCEVYVIFKNTEHLQTTAFGSISTAKWLGPKEDIMSSMKLRKISGWEEMMGEEKWTIFNWIEEVNLSIFVILRLERNDLKTKEEIIAFCHSYIKG